MMVRRAVVGILFYHPFRYLIGFIEYECYTMTGFWEKAWWTADEDTGRHISEAFCNWNGTVVGGAVKSRESVADRRPEYLTSTQYECRRSEVNFVLKEPWSKSVRLFSHCGPFLLSDQLLMVLNIYWRWSIDDIWLLHCLNCFGKISPRGLQGLLLEGENTITGRVVEKLWKAFKIYVLMLDVVHRT